MPSWSIEDAKTRFAEFLGACLAEGPQIVTKQGADAAVLVPIEEWRRFQQLAQIDLLLASRLRFELELPDRRGFHPRPAPDFD